MRGGVPRSFWSRGRFSPPWTSPTAAIRIGVGNGASVNKFDAAGGFARTLIIKFHGETLMEGAAEPPGHTVANLTATFDPGTGRYSVERAFTAPGTYTYRVWARDAAGHWGAPTGTLVIPPAPPGGSPPGGLSWLLPPRIPAV